MAALSFNAVIICIIYLFVGLFLIILNQHILKALQFPYPMLLAGLGILASGIVSYCCILAGFVVVQRKEQVSGLLWYTRVLPIGLASAATLCFGNMVYLSLEIGFIQMLKSFTPVVIMLCAHVFKIQSPSYAVIYSVIVISIGTAMTCTFTPDVNIAGLIIMFLSMVSEAIRLVLTQYILQQLKFGVIESQYVLAPATAFWLFAASAFFEFRTIYENNHFYVLFDKMPYFIAASGMGVLVNFLGYSVIQSTSSLTMKILGTLRNIGTIAVGVLVYNEFITFYEGVGYFIALLGFLGYNLAEMGYFDKNFNKNNAKDKKLEENQLGTGSVNALLLNTVKDAEARKEDAV